MIGKLLNFIVGREPVAAATGLAGGVGALLGVLAAFDVWDPTPEQVGALTALAAWVAGYMARRVVTPVAKRLEPAEHGSVPLAVVLGVVFFVLLVGAFFATCDALFDDEDEDGDLGQGTSTIQVWPEPTTWSSLMIRSRSGGSYSSAMTAGNGNVPSRALATGSFGWVAKRGSHIATPLPWQTEENLPPATMSATLATTGSVADPTIFSKGREPTTWPMPSARAGSFVRRVTKVMPSTTSTRGARGSAEPADRSECDGSCRNDYRDCYQSRDYCSDDDKVDFRPVICVQPGSCQFGPDPQPT